MDFSKINKVARLEDFLPTKKIAELENGKTYKITFIKNVQTKFGPQVTVELDGEFSIFLPSRIGKMLHQDQEQFQELTKVSAENHLYLRYLGGKYQQCEFLYA